MIHNRLIIAHFIPSPELTRDTLVIACPVMIHNYGLLYYLEGIRQLRTRYPTLDLQLAVPCQDNVGLALKALEAGVKVIYFNRNHAAWPQLLGSAVAYEAQLLDQEALDG